MTNDINPHEIAVWVGDTRYVMGGKLDSIPLNGQPFFTDYDLMRYNDRGFFEIFLQLEAIWQSAPINHTGFNEAVAHRYKTELTEIGLKLKRDDAHRVSQFQFEIQEAVEEAMLCRELKIHYPGRFILTIQGGDEWRTKEIDTLTLAFLAGYPVYKVERSLKNHNEN